MEERALTQMEMFIENLNKIKERHQKLRLCFVGPSGAGKSSMIRTIMYALQKRIPILNKGPQVAVDVTAEQTTRHLQNYEIESPTESLNKFIHCLDTQGYSSTDQYFSLNGFEAILRGRIPYGTEFKNIEELASGSARSDPNRTIQILIFVFSGAAITVQDYEKAAAIYKKAIQIGDIVCGFAISQLDMLDANFFSLTTENAYAKATNAPKFEEANKLFNETVLKAGTMNSELLRAVFNLKRNAIDQQIYKHSICSFLNELFEQLLLKIQPETQEMFDYFAGEEIITLQLI